MFSSVLIANRGVCAVRIARTARALGLRVVAITVGDDAGHAAGADAVVEVPSYLDGDAIVAAALAEGAAAVIPGYGFLSENESFASAVIAAGLIWVGPTPAHLAAFATKHAARSLAEAAGVPVLPGSDLVESAEDARAAAEVLGYPILLKCTAGGGGVGQASCDTPDEIEPAFDRVRRLAGGAFGDARVFVEAYVPAARHVEVQIFGLADGRVLALGTRDCSAQRRRQKVMEEAPAPGLDAGTRRAMLAAAVNLCASVGYTGAGTVEFLVDATKPSVFYFLEVNARLQVEHAVTEQVCGGLDLVEAQLRTAAGLPCPPIEAAADKAASEAASTLHSIQARVYAEDAARGFAPSPGLLTRVDWPSPAPWLRLETAINAPGERVSPLYDPMLAKIVVTARTRAEALTLLGQALDSTHIDGVETNLPLLRALVRDSEPLREGRLLTRDVEAFKFVSHTCAVTAAPGVQAIVVDLGREGLWKAGIPPSGPADELAYRAANRLVGNADDNAAALELVLDGLDLTFACAARVAVTGATPAPLTVDGVAAPPWSAIDVPAGATLRVGRLAGPGARAYVAVAGGGFDVPPYLGSRTTFQLGGFGGHQGRALRVGDVLRLFAGCAAEGVVAPPPRAPPVYTNEWSVGAVEGPHSTGFMETADFLFDTPLRVHFNSNRLGVRLEGAAAPIWTRADGGDAGLHPSNVLDTVYSHRSINITGELPVFLGVDGPSLGGFVCPAVVCRSDAWKLGQARPGDTVRFFRVARADALKALAEFEATAADATPPRAPEREDPVLLTIEGGTDDGGRTLVRLAGEDAILVEFGGDERIDLPLRLAVRALTDALTVTLPPAALKELSPGVRSLHVEFDPAMLELADLLAVVSTAARGLTVPRRVPSRVLHLPLAFDASTTRKALERYASSVRAAAPYLPSNIDFVARINGCDAAAVRSAVFDASFLVLGLGDVYLGAPCALALDPRHRMVTTKMNPARVWTAEGEVGLGGSFMCVYGMDSPGGYQLVGRTAQMWSTWRTGSGRTPWLLNEFDVVRFFEVSEDELNAFRARCAAGEATLKVEQSEFDVDEYKAMLTRDAAAIAADRDRKQAAFEAERERWAADAPPEAVEAAAATAAPSADAWPDDAVVVRAPVAGKFTPAVAVGEDASSGAILAVVEAMKMEFEVSAPKAGGLTVLHVVAAAGALVDQGDAILVLHSGEPTKLAPEIQRTPTPVPPFAVDLSSLAALRAVYASSSISVASVVAEALRRVHAAAATHAFLHVTPLDELEARCEDLDAVPVSARGPLHGVPFGVKDNVDVSGAPTTAACPALSNDPLPTKSATAVQKLLAAGAVCLGKLNLDQWAAGLSGQRSPTGPIACVYNPAYISGGSSSGCGVAVGGGMVTFAIGSDTAGSGRVPAALNGVVGYKPTRGLISCAGVLPACASLDCVAVFAASCDDARAVARVAAGFDSRDPYSRHPPPTADAGWGSTRSFRFGVLAHVEEEGVVSASVRAGREAAAAAATSLGGTRVNLSPADSRLLLDVARLLYAPNSPWLAERLDAVRGVIKKHGWSALHPVTRAVLTPADDQRTVDAWPAVHALAQARAHIEARVWSACDCLLLPTAPRTFEIAAVDAEPLSTNATLGTYTNFCNLLDLAAVSVPAGLQEDVGVPFGMQLVAPAWSDDSLLELGQRLHAAIAPAAPLTLASSVSAGDLTVPLDPTGRLLGAGGRLAATSPLRAVEGNGHANGHALASSPTTMAYSPPTGLACSPPNGVPNGATADATITLFVVGLHLSGLPLNNQLLTAGASLARATHTAPTYTLHALGGGAKPGLVRRSGPAGGGAAVEGEVWRVPLAGFASFVSACVPPPLCIGNVELEDGTWVKGFLCESDAAAAGQDITAWGGWRAYVAARA